ncbi:hypothetical protein FQN57_002507 [Myotisia sp. PD_48]|nr:hypothetical protein FQN57_002507 [Myotisia sp. PD_48]
MAQNVGVYLRQLRSESGNIRKEVISALDCLPPETPVHQYQDIANMKDVSYSHADNGYSFCVFLNVSENDFYEQEDIRCGRKTYYSIEEILVIKMPTRGHEYAIGMLGLAITSQIQEMAGRRGTNDIIPMGASTIHNKEDLAYQPVVLPVGRTEEWPSITVEVGKSETHRQLYNDAQQWFQLSGGQIQAVITVKVSNNCITITRYKAAGRFLRAITEQTTTVQRANTGTIAITNGPFIIPFKALFLRAPTRNERDILLNDEDLKQFANRTWEGMEISS